MQQKTQWNAGLKEFGRATLGSVASGAGGQTQGAWTLNSKLFEQGDDAQEEGFVSAGRGRRSRWR